MPMKPGQGGPAPRPKRQADLADLLDRVLGKGLVIDAWVRCSLANTEVITCQARVVVASLDTYLRYAEAIALTALPPESDRLQQHPSDDELSPYLKNSPEDDSGPQPPVWYKISPN